MSRRPAEAGFDLVDVALLYKVITHQLVRHKEQIVAQCGVALRDKAASALSVLERCTVEAAGPKCHWLASGLVLSDLSLEQEADRVVAAIDMLHSRSRKYKAVVASIHLNVDCVFKAHSDSPVCFVGDLISAGSPMPADTQRTVIA